MLLSQNFLFSGNQRVLTRKLLQFAKLIGPNEMPFYHLLRVIGSVELLRTCYQCIGTDEDLKKMKHFAVSQELRSFALQGDVINDVSLLQIGLISESSHSIRDFQLKSYSAFDTFRGTLRYNSATSTVIVSAASSGNHSLIGSGNMDPYPHIHTPVVL